MQPSVKAELLLTQCRGIGGDTYVTSALGGGTRKQMRVLINCLTECVGGGEGREGPQIFRRRHFNITPHAIEKAEAIAAGAKFYVTRP